MNRTEPAVVVMLVVFAALAAGPLLAAVLEQPFVLFLLTRLMILAMAAAGLNMVLGFAGLPSFGHAALMGTGAYAAGIAALEAGGISGWFAAVWGQAVVATLAAAVVAFAMGAISLRTHGIAFILITLALGQMLFYVGVSLERYGGDDGTIIPSAVSAGSAEFYYSVWMLLSVVTVGAAWVRASPFGSVLRGGAVNESRIAAVGISLTHVRLAAFTASGAICGLAGALMAHQTAFISPATMSWTHSAELVAMVLLGGAGTVAGPLLGAGAFVVLEELLSGFTVHWRIVFGPLLVLVVLFARGGLAGWINGRAP